MWRDLLETACAAKGAAQVARELEYSQTTLSLVRSGKYPGGTARIAAAVMARYGRVDCPHLGESIEGDACAAYRNRPTPTSSPPALRHWVACQACALNPNAKEKP